MSPDEDKTKEQLINELARLRQRNAELALPEIERKRAAEELQVLSSITQQVTDSIIVTDTNYEITYINKATEDLFGYNREELEGRTPDILNAEPSAERIQEEMRQNLSSGGVCVGSLLNRRKDGGTFVCEYKVSPLRDKEGRILAHIGVQRDITERKRAEEALRESEEKYRALFESTLDGAFVFDAETMKVLLANQAAAKMYGFDSVEDAVGTNPLDSIPLDDRERVIRIIAEDMFEKDLRQVNEFRTMTKDGREIWISAVGVRTEYQGRLAGLVSFRDITERKRGEEALQESEERLKTFIESAPESFSLYDSELNLLVISQVGLSWFPAGSKKEDIIGKNMLELAPYIKQTGRYEEYVKVLKTGKVFFAEDIVSHPDFGGKHLHVRAFKVGKGLGIIATDITKRKQAEETLRESEERYRALVNLGGSVGEAIVMVQDNEQGKAIHTFVSNEWLSITGYSRKELLGMSFSDLLHPRDREASLARHKKRMSGEIIPGLFEMSIIRKDGTEVPVELTSAYTTYRGERANVAFIRDITERKRMEEREKELQKELNLSSRLSSVGELAAGVAHELNNPLTGIVGFSERLMRRSTSKEISRDLERIHNQAQRAAKVVENLRTFARRREPKKEYLDINEILGRTLELRAYELKTGNIELVVELTPGLPKIFADFGQIQQVFLNIILNAEQVMTEANGGGRLTIKTQKGKGCVNVSFADDGPGIPAEHLDKLFDPFFTTRGEQGGTGLGLSACHGIVAEHGGKIYAKSKPGKGATFFVELPVAPEEIDESEVAEEEPVRRG